MCADEDSYVIGTPGRFKAERIIPLSQTSRGGFVSNDRIYQIMILPS